jgi:hypothetical protein
MGACGPAVTQTDDDDQSKGTQGEADLAANQSC